MNVPGIVGFGKAAEIAFFEMEGESARILKLRNKLESGLKNIEGATINSEGCDRLPNTTNISFKDIDGNLLLRKMNSLAISRGSACTSTTNQVSHVLKSMGLSNDLALSSFRISLESNTHIEGIEFAVKEIAKTVNQLKRAMV